MSNIKEVMLSSNFLTLTQKLNSEKLIISNKIINLEINGVDSFYLSNSSFYNCDFTGFIILNKSDDENPKLFWEKSTFEKCNFMNFSLLGASKNKPLIMNNSIFNECNFNSVKFCNCTLVNVEFKNIELFENVEFEDIITWNESNNETLIFSDIRSFRKVTFADSYIRGLILENIKNANDISFEDIEIDEIIRFKDIKIKSLNFTDTKYLDSEKIPTFENCILEDVVFKDSSEFEFFLENESGITLFKRDNSILTISIKCSAEQKSFTLNFLSNLKKSLQIQYKNLVSNIIETSIDVKLIINSIDDEIEHQESLSILEELTTFISKYFSDIKIRYSNFNKSELALKSNQNQVQAVYNLMGDLLFLNSLQNNEMMLQLTTKLDSNSEKLNQILKKIEEEPRININNNSTISLGAKINMPTYSKGKISIKTESDYEFNSSTNILDDTKDIDIEHKSKVSWLRKITIGKKRNIFFWITIIFAIFLIFLSYEQIIIMWNNVSIGIFK